MYDKANNKFVNDKQFSKIQKMLDDFYGFKPDSLNYEKVLERLKKKKQ